MGGKSGPSTTQSVQIPQFLQPFMQQQAQTGQQALGNLQGQLGGAGAEELVAGFTPAQLQSFDLAQQAATGAGGAVPTALDTLGQTARGDFLFGGPGFQEAVDASVRAAQPSILSTFGAAGRGTGGLAQAAIGQQATDAFSRMFGQERQRQMQAAQLLPQIAGQGVGLLGDVGALQQQQAQQELLAPISAQQQLLGASGGAIPLQALLGQQVQEPGGNQLAGGLLGGLGGALSGSEIGAATTMFSPGTGALIGGGVGALGGLLS